MENDEPRLNAALATALAPFLQRANVNSEALKAFAGSARKPDILIHEQGAAPVVIETEVQPARSVERDAKARLGETMRASGRVVESAIAVRIPQRYRDLPQANIISNFQNDDKLEYALFNGDAEAPDRFPGAGWLVGSVRDLAAFSREASLPERTIEQATGILESGVIRAAGRLSSSASKEILAEIAADLHQPVGEQTWRMAATIIANAFTFHENLAGFRGITSPDGLRHEASGALSKTAVLKEWRKILRINYYPIFKIALDIAVKLQARLAAEIFDLLQETASQLAATGITRSHDLSGTVFQRLISDRKALATFYTSPPAATLLSVLAIPEVPAGRNWGDPKALTEFRMADFACGTGTLLSTAYQRLIRLHEAEGGNAATCHAAMMQQALTGCDVLPASVHLTASMLAAAFPRARFYGTRVHTLPYGRTEQGKIMLGSLDLLERQSVALLFASEAPVRQTGSGMVRESSNCSAFNFPWRTYDLVIMNPPFTRATNHEGERSDIANPAVSAFQHDAKTQGEMGSRLNQLARNTVAHGNAGLASHFVALADKMVKDGGHIALVLPLVALQGISWSQIRELWESRYRDIRIVTIAGARDKERSFSADTGMAEILIVAEKANGGPRRGRSTFINLRRQPRGNIEALEIARAVQNAPRARRLEAGPQGGTDLYAGEQHLGHMLSVPFGAWFAGGVEDAEVAQCAWQLARGKLWLPGQPKSQALEIPIVALGEIAERGLVDRDINGAGGRGPFDIEKIEKSVPTRPTLWAHNHEKERRLVVAPDREARPRKGADEDHISRVWQAASRVHFNLDFQFTSQPLGVCLTERPALGGQAWPNLSFHNPLHEIAFVLWANSTLGLLLHWGHATRQQAGRGRITISRVPDLPTLNLHKLRKPALQRCEKIFGDLRQHDFMPMHMANRDSAREELDRRFLGEVLKLPPGILAPLGVLRGKLCGEPSVHGGQR
ncbi:MAG: hypothetical protein OXU53_01745 [Deltaproteobacteria bacterium]|nr:hypothetical protein [Deltaproteobacteria bacterium]